MLNRDQQQLLGALGTGMASDALLDRLRQRGTLEGGRSSNRAGCWINYNRKAVQLEDHSEISVVLRAAGSESPTGGDQPWRRMKPTVVVKVTWAEAAAYGASLPPELRDELTTLDRAERDENQAWWKYSNERGGWPHRRRFNSDAEHRLVQDEWGIVYGKHIRALGALWDRQKAAISRALPLTVDDEPVDLLELLDQQPAAQDAVASARAASTPVLQAAALQRTTGGARPPDTADGCLFTMPAADSAPGR